jgi:hypothetical protein
VDELDPQVLAERGQQFPAKRTAIIKEHVLGEHLPLPHGGNHRFDRNASG